MDPITAISLASSLITFVEFASKIVTGTYEVYNSTAGNTIANAHIDTVIGDLEKVAADLETGITGKSKHKRALEELASKCNKLANDLLQLLNRVRSDGSHSTWKSLRATLISMRKQKEIIGMERRLNDYRSQILMRLTLILQDQNCSVKLQLDRLETVSLNLSSESASRAKELREDILQAIKHLDPKASSSDTVAASRDRMLKLEQGLNDLSSLITTVPRENIILENLYYDSLDLRKRTIADAENGTFEWLFTKEVYEDKSNVIAREEARLEGSDPEGVEPKSLSTSSSMEPANVEEKHEGVEGADTPLAGPAKSASFTENEQPPEPPDLECHETDVQSFQEEQLKLRAKTRGRFMAWLNSGSGVFHISGKAGSGKSTLLKFIYSHERTEAELKEWAGQKKLIFAAFYFWKSDDKMQMSLEGLYRSILFTTLRQCPELIPVVFPTHWEKLKNRHYLKGNFISYSDLVSAFEALTSTETFSNHRFCYFVDGLDEYHGQTKDHLQLAKDLQHWARNVDVKICASSRPYIEYEKLSSSSDRLIRLHELTRHDIQLFCQQMIEKDDNFEQIKDSYMGLVKNIVERSQGVFLWARLVMNSLLVGMLRHDNLETLEKKLDMIPDDLNQLYNQLLNSLDKVDQERAMRLLSLTAHCTTTIITYWMMDNFDYLNFSPRNGARPTSWPSTEKMAVDARLQIKSLTKGLLETSTQRFGDIGIGTVHFFHRTARDFVLEQLGLAQEPKLGDHAINLFDDEIAFARLRLAELTSYDLRTRKVVWNVNYLHWAFESTKSFPLEVMDAYRCLLDDNDNSTSTSLENDDIFLGPMSGPKGYVQYMHRLSFVHMAAFMGQLDYVLREVDADPTLLKSGKELSVLISALSGGHVELAEGLIKRGCSPADSMSCWYQAKLEGCPDGSIPIWLAIFQHNVATFFISFNRSWEQPWPGSRIWELLLTHPHVNARNCFLLLSSREEDTATHFITLKQFIEERKPEKMDRLLALLDEGQNNSFMKGAKEFLSRFIPGARKPEPSLTTKTDAYIPYSLGEWKTMRVRAIVCDDIHADGCWIRVF